MKFILFPHKKILHAKMHVINRLHSVIELCYGLSSVFNAWVSFAVMFLCMNVWFLLKHVMGLLSCCRTFAWNSLQFFMIKLFESQVLLLSLKHRMKYDEIFFCF